VITRRSFVLGAATAVSAIAQDQQGHAAKPAYPPSRVAGGIKLDWTTHKRAAQGSDNFQLTWAEDDHLYGAWGDGGGFGGTNSDGRVSLGFARVEGPWDSFRGVNVWGGKDALHPATFAGKSWGTIAIDQDLYMWVVPKSLLADMQSEARLHHSSDSGATWRPASWAFTRADGLTIPTICQFGRGNSGARDRYVYHYFIAPQETREYRVQKPGAIHLLRSPKNRLMDADAYEVYAGSSGNRPLWSKDRTKRRAVFEDEANGTGWVCSVSYNRQLERYILMTDHTESPRGNLGIYEAPEPWGPWSTIAFFQHSDGRAFGSGYVEPNTFFWSLPTKWQDGREFAMVFTGAGRGKDNDSFNVVKGAFEQ
jgi:hypothetical protein